MNNESLTLVGCETVDLFNKQVSVGDEVFVYGVNKSVHPCKTLSKANLNPTDEPIVSILIERVKLTIPLKLLRIVIKTTNTSR